MCYVVLVAVHRGVHPPTAISNEAEAMHRCRLVVAHCVVYVIFRAINVTSSTGLRGDKY